MAERNLASARSAALDVMFRAIRSYSAASSLAALGVSAPEVILPAFRARSEQAIQHLVSTGAPSEISAMMAKYSGLSNDQSVSHAQNGIAGACLIFSHSLADGSIQEFCLLAADFDMKYWGKVAARQTITIQTLVERGDANVLRTAIRGKIRTMSLPSKMKYLLQHAGPHSKVEYPLFSYDKHRLAELDSLRHKIIHEEGLTLPIPIRDSQEFFFNLTIYAGLVTSSLLGLGISYPHLFIEWLQSLVDQVQKDSAVLPSP